MPKGAANKRAVQEIAEDYFSYLGKNLPQQCASDEFYFLPRAEQARRHLNRLDDLTPERVLDHTRYVESMIAALPRERGGGLEQDIDAALLELSMNSFLREFRDMAVWRSDPTLYVKIPLLGTAHAMAVKQNADPGGEALAVLFSQIPPFLGQAAENLETPSGLSLAVTLEMVQDALRFFTQDVPLFLDMHGIPGERLEKQMTRVIGAWKGFEGALRRFSPEVPFAVGEGGLEMIFSKSLGLDRSPGEVLELAQAAHHRTMEKIRALVRTIGKGKDWASLRSERVPMVSSSQEALTLYRKEVGKLRAFLYGQDIIPFPPGEAVAVLETPVYLRSLRATASYRAPLTGDTSGQGIFFITPGEEDMELISGHCPYLSAHETYPGHHILDHIRIHHPNPVRRQIESALFYEGWACYAEQLLDDQGYITEPRQQLIQLERQLWRCLRAVLDVKLQTGAVDLEEGKKAIQGLGFSEARARRQIRRFALTPGYQSCYFLGTLEIMGLREKYARKMGLKRFHDILLGGGEIPFHLVERRLDASTP